MNAAEEPARKLEHLVATWQKALLNICYMSLHDHALAEDAVQETFMKAYRNLNTFRGESSEKTWLMRIALNTCRDMRRSAWFAHVNRAVIPEELPLAASESDGTSDDPAPELADAIMHLPDKLREAVLLYYYQEMTMAEVAQAVGVTPSMVCRRLKKAHVQLRGMLGEEDLYE